MLVYIERILLSGHSHDVTHPAPPLSLMVQVPLCDGSPSVQRRIDLYCEEVKSRGGTPPTPFVSSRLRSRRFTMPHLDSVESLLPTTTRGRSSSSSDVAQMPVLCGAASLMAVEEHKENGIASGPNSNMRKTSSLSMREIELQFGDEMGSDSDDGGDYNETVKPTTPATMTASWHIEVHRLREENRLLKKQLKASHSGHALLPFLSEDDPGVSLHTYVCYV